MEQNFNQQGRGGLSWIRGRVKKSGPPDFPNTQFNGLKDQWVENTIADII